MNKLIVALCVAVLATAKVNRYSAGSGYQHKADVGEYHLQGAGHSNDSGSSTSADDAEGYSDHDGNGKNIPYQYVNTRDNSVSSLLTYPNNKGQILIHRPAAIIIKRPPTKVVVNHPPLVIKPAPVVLHKPPPVVMRRVFVKHHPRPVKVEPVYINVLKPPAEKYFMEEKQHPTLQPSFAPARVNTDFAPISDDADQNGDAEFDTSDIESASSSTNFYLLENH